MCGSIILRRNRSSSTLRFRAYVFRLEFHFYDKGMTDWNKIPRNIANIETPKSNNILSELVD